MKARKVVFNALTKVENDGYSTIILNSILNSYDGNDSAFITALYYGVIERKITLDYILDKYIDKGIKSLKIEVLTILRMGLYEALFMSAPLYAITNKYVNIAKNSKFKSAQGLINAVLRKAGSYDVKYLENKPNSVKYSVNDAVFNTIEETIGTEATVDFFNNSFNAAPVFAVWNHLKGNIEIPSHFEKTDLDNVYKLPTFSTNDKLFKNGYYYIQDISAANSIYLANPKENERILDLCSAPGGKSFTAYLLSNGKADITSCDVYAQRLFLVRETADKLGFKINTVINDATKFNRNLGEYDLVICDVPCTGFGVIRRKPEIKYKNQSEIESIKELQINIVNNAVKYVKSGGRLLYSTCTINKKENEDIVNYILKNNSDFYLDIQKTMLPNEKNGDGFYAAVIKRRWSMSKIDIKSMLFDELSLELSTLNLPSFRIKQIYTWLHKGIFSFEEMTNVSKELRATLNDKYDILNVKIKNKYVSNIDGTIKYLYELHDGELIESVVMKYEHGYSVCVSTQAGCRMGCSFCASGLYGLVRNLTASEILSQITTAQNDLDIRISNVVLMGMGEPLDNYDNVIKFLKLVSSSDGINIGLRHISLSTCGIVPKIYELANENLPITLSVSLHAPNNEIRDKMMKINHKYKVEELITACKDYFKKTGRRISFEYAIIDGVNNSNECVEDLHKHLKGFNCHINLIPANPVEEKGHAVPNKKCVFEFKNKLESLGLNATVRRTLGSDINASCGQLRNKERKWYYVYLWQYWQRLKKRN